MYGFCVSPAACEARVQVYGPRVVVGGDVGGGDSERDMAVAKRLGSPEEDDAANTWIDKTHWGADASRSQPAVRTGGVIKAHMTLAARCKDDEGRIDLSMPPHLGDVRRLYSGCQGGKLFLYLRRCLYVWLVCAAVYVNHIVICLEKSASFGRS